MVLSTNGNLGIGETNPQAKLDVNGNMDISTVGTTINNSNNVVDVDITGALAGLLGGFTIRYSDFPDGGVGLYARENNNGSLLVTTPDGLFFRPVEASAFTVSSDKRLKRDIQYVGRKDAKSYMKQIRSIESASFWYKSEKNSERSTPHIGVIAQSLPKALQVEMYENAAVIGERRLGVSLSDWLGLVTIGVKENDQRLIELEEQQTEIEALKEENNELRQRLSKIEAMLSGTTNEINTTTTTLTSATLQQNAPNPFTEATNIRYFIPEGTKSASLQVMDQNGRVIKSIPIQATGEGQVTLQANLLSAGTYSYALILDGQVMETKQMVLTK
jgi:hypothetical protein